MSKQPSAKTHAEFGLPPSIVTKVDVSRMINELESVDNQLTAMAVRARTTRPPNQTPPILSDQLTDFLKQNKLDIDTGRERRLLIQQLRLLKDKMPVIHMTFAVTADRESLSQLVHWLRTSVHAQAVISVGLQPALVAGVYMRTPNHVHDFSLRAALARSHEALVKELEVSRAEG